MPIFNNGQFRNNLFLSAAILLRGHRQPGQLALIPQLRQRVHQTVKILRAVNR